MATRRITGSQEPPTPRSRPATTPEDREMTLTSLAWDLAEKQLRDGSASSQVISHYLKAGSQRERLEQERLKGENALIQAKIDNMASAKRIEELYENALHSMRAYQGRPVEEDVFDD